MEKPVDPTILKCTIDLMPLSACTQKTLRKSFFFSHVTSIQQKAIPIFMQPNTNVVVEACTGSGKTMTFLLPIVEKLLKHNADLVERSGRVQGRHC